MSGITIQRKGITKADVDAIVNAANDGLRAGGGVCGAIFEEAGHDEMAAACRSIGHCDTGSVVITPGFALKAKYVIHAVGPIWSGGGNGEADLLASCYSKAIDLAVENRCESIAFPLISSGVYGYPKEQAWHVAIGACLEKLSQLDDRAPEVVFCVMSDSSLSLGTKTLHELSGKKGGTGQKDRCPGRLHSDQRESVPRDASNAIFFHNAEGPYGFLSNWYISWFDVDGVSYSSMEQYMMHQKALIFGDVETAVEIVNAKDPAEIKALGRKVKPFDSTIWAGRAQIIVYRGLLEKFKEGSKLADMLVGTGDAILVECARGDRIWANGLAEDDARRFDVSQWKGKNLLGFALMEVRSRLRYEREKPNAVGAMAPTQVESEIAEVKAEVAEREEKYLDACQGCLIGGAVGDALGYAVEFSSRDSILRKYGPDGIMGYELDPASGLALFSDDTQMTLFTGMGYLVGLTRYSLRGVGGPNGHIRNAYMDWLRTQEQPYSDDVEGPWLVHVSGLYSRRAPGNTCLSALKAGGHGTVDEPINNSKGCGGVMRVAPLGLAQELTSPMETAADAAAMTHGHPLGYMPAAALAYIVNRCMRERDSADNPKGFLGAVVRDCADELPTWFPDRLLSYSEELGNLLRRAVELAEGAGDDASCISELGEGWVGEEAIAIAVFCAVRHADSFDEAIVAAVNHDGDSDSTGAICGNIVGTLLGLKAIGPKWTEKLELAGVIMELAKDLCDGCRMEEFGSYRDEIWLSKYGAPHSMAMNDYLRSMANRSGK